ncbi:MAG: hypothetical protein K6L76_00450 [Agarilytica sp.]
MKISFLSVVAVVALFAAPMSFAAQQCPAIDCDCSALSQESWVKTCEQHEARIQKACVENGNTPKDYCAVHGPSAKPLPLSLEINEYKNDASVKASAVKEELGGATWAMTSDIDSAIKAYDEKAYARTLKILKLINGSSDKAFQLQLQLAALLSTEDSKRAYNSSWKKYSKGVKPAAEKLEIFGSRLASLISTASTKKEQKIFSVLSQKALRIAGKNYEHVGYGDGQSGRDGSAAKTWSKAAKISSKIAQANRDVSGTARAIKFAEYQAAARLHRASFHWLRNESLGDSVAALKNSQEYLDHDAQKEVDVLITKEEEKSSGGLGGILSGR